jgi:hypothetical protein
MCCCAAAVLLLLLLSRVFGEPICTLHEQLPLECAFAFSAFTQAIPHFAIVLITFYTVHDVHGALLFKLIPSLAPPWSVAGVVQLKMLLQYGSPVVEVLGLLVVFKQWKLQLFVCTLHDADPDLLPWRSCFRVHEYDSSLHSIIIQSVHRGEEGA